MSSLVGVESSNVQLFIHLHMHTRTVCGEFVTSFGHFSNLAGIVIDDGGFVCVSDHDDGFVYVSNHHRVMVLCICE